VQQIDTQGPVVIERVTTQYADLTCTPENARAIIEGLHAGSAITLTADGKTASFTPTGNLGYGEAYIAMALAAEALRNAGVTSCATPEQWKAVFVGGPLVAAGTTTTTSSIGASASSSSNFPGILALRTQGQGWGQIAQTTNVQLGTVMSSAKSAFNASSSGSTSTLSPTGKTSAEMNAGSKSSSTTPSSTSTDSAIKPDDRDKGKDKDDADRDQPQPRSDAGRDTSASRPDTTSAPDAPKPDKGTP
jgi:hypothetical protein